MKRLLTILLFVVCLSGLENNTMGQTTKTIQTITANATVNSTAEVVLATGTNALTLTLPSSPVTGRVLTIVNHTTQELTLSETVTVTATKGTALVSDYVSVLHSATMSNKITIIYDGTVWRLIGN